MLVRLLPATALAVAVAVAVSPAGAHTGASAPVEWTGTARVPAGAEPVRVSLVLRDTRAVVTLGPGHPNGIPVALRRSDDGRLRFNVPGRPSLAFSGAVGGKRLTGTIRQGRLRGSFALRPGRAADDEKTGVYRRSDGSALGIVATQFGRALVDYTSGEIRGLYGGGASRDVVGGAVARRSPVAGELRYGAGGLTWRGAAAARVGLRQVEVRFLTRGTTLAGTLTLPPGSGPFPAAALVHGSGPMPRENQTVFASYLASRGIATLVYDKRGIGWSGGTYLGESASQRNIDLLARDAEAAARFLAAQREVDRARVGLVGVSQAGWIMPLAATREPAVRWLVPLVGPTVTQGESDLWGHAIGLGADTIRTFADVEAEVRSAGPSGVDPMPWIRALRIPALWVWGSNDRHVPTALCVERLKPLLGTPGTDLAYIVLPRANHGLLDSAHGLSSEVDTSSMLAPGLFPALDDWLRSHGLAP